MDGNKTNAGTTGEGIEKLGPANVAKWIFGELNVGLDIGKEVDKAGTGNVADVDEERSDEKAEINHDDGDDDAREDAFYAVIVDAETGNLGVDDDEEENDENNIGNLTGFLPDFVDGGFVVGGDGLDDEEIVDVTINTVDEFAGGIEEGAESPRG